MWRAFLAHTTLVTVSAQNRTAFSAFLKLSTTGAVGHDIYLPFVLVNGISNRIALLVGLFNPLVSNPNNHRRPIWDESGVFDRRAVNLRRSPVGNLVGKEPLLLLLELVSGNAELKLALNKLHGAPPSATSGLSRNRHFAASRPDGFRKSEMPPASSFDDRKWDIPHFRTSC